ncbi:MAG: hypothetical protein ACR2KB_13285 [Chitinophagaceae bacterium]
MKSIKLFTISCFISLISFSQIQVEKKDGGSVITNLGYNIKVNEGSSLNRQYIILNDANSPIQIYETGVKTSYADRSYSFIPVGNLIAKEPVTAIEINYVLYNVFGEHIKTLAGKEIKDISSSMDLSKIGTWYASENQISEYLICVAFVANVRKQNGTIWKYNYKSIKEQLNKLTIAFEENYTPQKDNGK